MRRVHGPAAGVVAAAAARSLWAVGGLPTAEQASWEAVRCSAAAVVGGVRGSQQWGLGHRT